MRSAVTQRRRDDITAEREEQIRMKKDLAQHQRDEEDYFAKMWFADMEAKSKREDEETRRKSEANRQTFAILQQQIAELEEKKRQEKELLEEQANILVSRPFSLYE